MPRAISLPPGMLSPSRAGWSAWPAAWPRAAMVVPGFLLFLILNATLFIRPAEIVPFLLGANIYLGLILACLLFAFPQVIEQLSFSHLRERPMAACVLMLLGFVVLSHLGHMELEKAAQTGFEFAKVVVYFLLLITIINTPERLRGFLYCFGAFSFVVAGLGILHFHGVITIPTLTVLNDFQFNPATGKDEIFVRLRGTGAFNDPNELCLILVVGAIIAWYGLTDRQVGLARYLWLPALVLFVYALSLTKSRGGLLAFLAGTLVVVRARFGTTRTLIGSVLLVPVFLLLVGGRQANISVGDTGLTRIQLWSDGLMMLKESPAFGVGVDEYGKNAGLVAHNSFLHAFAELGFAGGMIFLGAFALAIFLVFRLNSRGRNILHPELRRLQPFILAIVAAYVTAMLSLSVCYIVATYTILGLASAYVSMATTYPVTNTIVLDGQMLRRFFVTSLLFLTGLYVFVRVFVRW